MVEGARQSSARAHTILVVEDDVMLRDLFEVVLSNAGYTVDCVSNGAEGLAFLRQSMPDLIISDVMMPVMDGMEFLARLRADPTWHYIPVILLTAQSAAEHVIAGLELGADDYITKPIDLNVLLARVRAKILRPPIPVNNLRRDRQTGFMSETAFRQALAGELDRARRGGYTCMLANIRVYEIEVLRNLYGARVDSALALSISQILKTLSNPLDLLGRASDGSYLVFSPEADAAGIADRLEIINKEIVRSDFTIRAETFRVTPMCGYAVTSGNETAEQLLDRARIALAHAMAHLDLRPIGFEEGMAAAGRPRTFSARLKRALEPFRLPAQVLMTYILGWFLPFLFYLLCDRAGFDITHLVYIAVVVALVLTALLIWTEGFMAIKRRDPPEVSEDSFGPVSAIIAAYLPNEAPTLETTIQAFLAMDYPAPIQIILAYNTPTDMPIEERLRDLARRNPSFVPLRVEGSTSKAQNVNAAISIVTSPIVGIYDADHHPDPDSFRRAWRWLNSGTDIVQGHCLIRNGDASWVSRIVAVEFELIYAVNHPGRDRFHDFAIFGGSNGFWRTDLLREVRMRGSMLTEDIDSSIRAVQGGHEIASDAYLVSRELAPTSLRALTNQRLRWAQGWYQVAKHQMIPSMRAKHMTLRQKLGLFHLLAWREVFPWISIQIVPIIAYWMWRAGSIHSVDWFVPLLLWLSLFIFVTGPGQLLFAWKLADPEIKRRPWWFWNYLLMSILFYSGYKNVLARVANIKEEIGEKSWKVTPRG